MPKLVHTMHTCTHQFLPSSWKCMYTHAITSASHMHARTHQFLPSSWKCMHTHVITSASHMHARTHQFLPSSWKCMYTHAITCVSHVHARTHQFLPSSWASTWGAQGTKLHGSASNSGEAHACVCSVYLFSPVCLYFVCVCVQVL